MEQKRLNNVVRILVDDMEQDEKIDSDTAEEARAILEAEGGSAAFEKLTSNLN